MPNRLATQVSLIDTAQQRRGDSREDPAAAIVHTWHDDNHQGGFAFCDHELCAAVAATRR